MRRTNFCQTTPHHLNEAKLKFPHYALIRLSFSPTTEIRHAKGEKRAGRWVGGRDSRLPKGAHAASVEAD
jgi:hypothetical protein